MSTPKVDDWDTIAPTTQRAVVAKLLRERRPGAALREYLDDAEAILDALKTVAESFASPPAEEFGLTAGQQIRLAVATLLAQHVGYNPSEIDRLAAATLRLAAVVETGV